MTRFKTIYNIHQSFVIIIYKFIISLPCILVIRNIYYYYYIGATLKSQNENVFEETRKFRHLTVSF